MYSLNNLISIFCLILVHPWCKIWCGHKKYIEKRTIVAIVQHENSNTREQAYFWKIGSVSGESLLNNGFYFRLFGSRKALLSRRITI